MQIRREIRQSTILRWLLEKECICIGGYPLWLSGYSPYYSDIDIQTKSWTTYYSITKTLSDYWVESTRASSTFLVNGDLFQIVQPVYYRENHVADVDFTASGIELVYKDGRFGLETPYKSDIMNRMARCLIKDPVWYDYRASTHIQKGFIVYE